MNIIKIDKQINDNFLIELKKQNITLNGLSWDNENIYITEDYPDLSKLHGFLEIYNPDDLSYLCEKFINEMKTLSYNYIIKKYPEWKQNNILRDYITNQMGEDPVNNFIEMSTFIDNTRLIINSYELKIKEEAQLNNKNEMERLLLEVREILKSGEL